MRLGATRKHSVDAAASEEELVALARKGNEDAVRGLVQRCNQQLFRAARGVMRDDSEAEDVVQEAYVRAFTSLDSFRGDSAFANLADPHRLERGLWTAAAEMADGGTI